MKKCNITLVLIFVLASLTSQVQAQIGKAHNVGSAQNFISTIKAVKNQSNLRTSASIELPVGNNKSHSGKQNVSMVEKGSTITIGEVENEKQSTYYFEYKNNEVKGKIILPNKRQVFEYYTENGVVMVKEVDINTVMCIGKEQIPPAATAPTPGAPEAITAGEAALLQSTPGASAVVKLDFDGEVVTGTAWNSGGTINATASSFTPSDIKSIWRTVSQDFSPFNINITTSETVYQNALPENRIKCIITPTDAAYPGAGGVAYVGSFHTASSYIKPCWVFSANLANSPLHVAEAASHEIGHTMGLSHDGRNATPFEDYYYGQGDWAPIMGVGYNRNIVQWSKGEYALANNLEDDVNIIATTNGFSYKADEDLNTLPSATPLNLATYGVTKTGLISTAADVDYYSFSISATRTLDITISTLGAPKAANLNIKAQLLNASGGVITTLNPTGIGSVQFTNTLGIGSYYISVEGVGEGNVLTTGYTDYGSIGTYTITNNYDCANVWLTGGTFDLNTTVKTYFKNNNDYKYYSITIPQPGLLSVSMTGLTYSSGMYIPDPTDPEVTLVDSRNFYCNNCFQYNFTTPGTYTIIAATSASGFTKQCYTLTNTFTPASGGSREASTSEVSNVSASVKEIQLYPNPASNSVKVTNAEDICSFEILSLTGEVVKVASEEELNSEISIANLSSGMYLIKMVRRGETIVKKLQVAK